MCVGEVVVASVLVIGDRRARSEWGEAGVCGEDDGPRGSGVCVREEEI